MERAAIPQCALHFDTATHLLHQLTRNGGSQPGAAETPTDRGVGLNERREDRIHLLRRHADSGITYLHVHLACFIGEHNLDTAHFRELDGIAHEIVKNLQDAQRVATIMHRHIIGVARDQGQIFGLRRQPQR